ncbi:Myotubularin-like phosphatase domain-containing protein, partial [Blyttiomyces helicus]
SIDQAMAFSWKPEKPLPKSNGWNVYDPVVEFGRLGVGTRTENWRLSSVNQDYEFSSTYPRILVVPARISDNVLKYTGKFRSKARIPSLSYLHRTNMASITRSAQPLTGIQGNRSIQDEKLVEAIFASTAVQPAPGIMHLLLDARPHVNAMGQTALGAGFENMDNYRGAKMEFLGIENIHVIRESLNKLIDGRRGLTIASSPSSRLSRSALEKSGWLKHIRAIVDGTLMMVRGIHLENAHVLVHCSDGWDRTAQLSSLAQICLDPYYRTISGFAVLVEKEWVAFGHKFQDRCGHLSRDAGTGPDRPTVGAHNDAISNGASGSPGNSIGSHTIPPTETCSPSHAAPREVAPVFTQFLDCVYQLWTQFPTHFEFSPAFLAFLNLHVHSCQFGNFLFNCERERAEFRYGGVGIDGCTTSIWDYIEATKGDFANPAY